MGMQRVLAATEVAAFAASSSPSLSASALDSFLTLSSHSVSLQNGVSTMSFLGGGEMIRREMGGHTHGGR